MKLLAMALLTFAVPNLAIAQAPNVDYGDVLRSVIDPAAHAPVSDELHEFAEFKRGLIAGIALGGSMSDVVRKWGKPQSISSMHGGNKWLHYYDNATLLYTDYRLSQITLGHRQLMDASFGNGLSSQLTRADVLRILGQPKHKSHAGISYDVKGRNLSLTFKINGKFPKQPVQWGVAKLSSISIEGKSAAK